MSFFLYFGGYKLRVIYIFKISGLHRGTVQVQPKMLTCVAPHNIIQKFMCQLRTFG